MMLRDYAPLTQNTVDDVLSGPRDQAKRVEVVVRCGSGDNEMEDLRVVEGVEHRDDTMRKQVCLGEAAQRWQTSGQADEGVSGLKADVVEVRRVERRGRGCLRTERKEVTSRPLPSSARRRFSRLADFL